MVQDNANPRKEIDDFLRNLVKEARKEISTSTHKTTPKPKPKKETNDYQKDCE